MTTIADLVVSLRADAAGYSSTMSQSIRYVESLDAVANAASASLERLGKAYAAPQDAVSLQLSETALLEGIAVRREQTEKSLLYQRLQRMEQEAAAQWALAEQHVQQMQQEAAASWAMTEKKTQAALAEYGQRVALEDRLYTLTHTQREADLYHLQTYYARMRAQHRGNASMLALVDRAYMAERRAMEESMVSEGTGVLGTLGGRSGLKRTLRYGASMAFGMRGTEASMLISSMLSMSGAASVVIGSLVAIGGTYAAVERQAKALAEAQERYAESVRQTSLWQRQLSQADSTPAGKAHRGRAMELWEEANKMQEAAKKQIEALGIFDKMGIAWDSIVSGGRAKSSFGQMMLLQRKQVDELRDEAMKRMDSAREEDAYQRQSFRARLDAEVQGARIAALAEGSTKRRLTLLQKQKEEERALREEYAMRLRDAARDTTSGAAIRAGEIRIEQEAALTAQAKRHGIEAEALAHREIENNRKIEDIAKMQTEAWDRLAIAKGGSQADVALRKMEEQMTLLGATSEEIQSQLNLWKRIYQLEADLPLKNEFDQLNISIAESAGLITEVEANMRRLRLQHKEASDEQIKKLATAKDQARIAEWARAQKEAMRIPLEQFEEYKKKLDEATKAGFLAPAERQTALEKYIKDHQTELGLELPENRIETRGTFSSFELGSLQAGGVQDRIAKATRDTADNVEKLIRVAESKGIFFN